MNHTTLLNDDWQSLVSRLGGAEELARSACATKAFLRPRVFRHATDLLRMVLAYCLGEAGLRSTAVWAAAIGLVDVSNVALLKRLRGCGDWLSVLIGQVLASHTPQAGRGRLIRLIDATTVPKAGPAARKTGKLWRIHSAFDLPGERFGCFELTDQAGGEQLDRIPVVKDEIRIGDRAHMQPDRMANVIEEGADIVIRAGWKSVRWRDGEGAPVDLIATFKKAADIGRIDRPIWVARSQGPALALRLIAVKKPPEACAAARRKARAKAKKGGHTISDATLEAADWVILVTSLKPDAFSMDDILALYRLRWRIELGFKRLKSLVGLKGPPGIDERSARPWILAHLLMSLLLEPVMDGFEIFPPGRLTRPGAWRMLRQLVATLIQAIMPQPTLKWLLDAKPRLNRNLHEPPRKRQYQQMKPIG